MEYWKLNNGICGILRRSLFAIAPIFQYSTIPFVSLMRSPVLSEYTSGPLSPCCKGRRLWREG